MGVIRDRDLCAISRLPRSRISNWLTLFRFDDIRNLPEYRRYSQSRWQLGQDRARSGRLSRAFHYNANGGIKCIGTIYAPGLTFSRRVTHGHPSRRRPSRSANGIQSRENTIPGIRLFSEVAALDPRQFLRACR